MRPIKFRAWDDKKKDWLLGYDLPNLGGFSLFGEKVLLGEWSEILDLYLFERDGRKQEDLKVMQFTGLKDKNGKEIYEGDIIQSDDKYRAKIVWLDWKAGFDSDDIETGGHWDSHVWKDWEVIGNVWENPELLTTLKEEK